MRLPRHDISLRLPVLDVSTGIQGDEALLDSVSSEALVRFWLPATSAVVVGLRPLELVGATVLRRRAGGGAVLVDDQMLCGAVCVPIEQVAADVTESYRWLGDLLAGVLGGRRVEVDEARADVAGLRARADSVSRLLLACCYGALSPHEVVDLDGRKIAGLAQVRRRHAALFQFGILFRDQSPLADLLDIHEEDRAALRRELRQRSGAVSSPPQAVFSAVAAACSRGATPSAR
jgi:lipoate-protein ligase A